MGLPVHADLMPWKRSLGRSKGQPVASDCSGNAGIVVAGGGWRNGWIWAGSGKMGMGRVPGGRRMRRRMKRIDDKEGECWSMLYDVWIDCVCVCVLLVNKERERGEGRSE